MDKTPIPFTVFDAAQVETLFNFPDGDATGQTVGVIGWGKAGGIGIDVDTLEAWFNAQGLPVPDITLVPMAGQSNGTTSGELMMDCKIVGTFAQGAEIRVYLALGNADSIAAAMDAAVADGCSVTTCSFGSPRSSWERSDRKTISRALKAAAKAQVTTCFASGDSGAGKLAFPAVSRHALAVGGVFYPTSSTDQQPSVWWNWPNPNGNASRPWWASGGGVAKNRVPRWQESIDPTSFPDKNGKTHTGRGSPDVAGMAQGLETDVGTSACSPLWAALIARINASLGFQVGKIHKVIYAHGQESGALVSVTTGDNIPPKGLGYPHKGYTAQPGWDACTGLGIPNGQLLMALLDEHKRPKKH